MDKIQQVVSLILKLMMVIFIKKKLVYFYRSDRFLKRVVIQYKVGATLKIIYYYDP